MSNNHPRLIRENKTIKTMVGMYCHDQHKTSKTLCNDCQELLEYAGKRLDKCPYQEQKPTCAKCPIHCYNQEKREQVREVMRYAGPRMAYRHPIMAMLHFIDGRRKHERRT